jgi:CMP-N-acetylneuraminic acid synthetase
VTVAEQHRFTWFNVDDCYNSQTKWYAQNYDVKKRPRRQDAKPHYVETGSFYLSRASLYNCDIANGGSGCASGSRLSPNSTTAYVLGDEALIEIDTWKDWYAAQGVGTYLKERDRL